MRQVDSAVTRGQTNRTDCEAGTFFYCPDYFNSIGEFRGPLDCDLCESEAFCPWVFYKASGPLRCYRHVCDRCHECLTDPVSDLIKEMENERSR